MNDDQGFSVELLHVESWYERQMGFRPCPTPRLAPLAGRTPARLRGERRFAKALVTGAAGGMGTELARLAAEDETSLVLVDRDADGLSRLAAELGDGAEVATLELDLADLEAVDAATAELLAEHPDIDLLIAAAGLDRAQSLLAFDWRQARDDFTVNSLANLVLLSHLAPAMAKRGGGHVTAIASLAGLIGMPYEAPYSGSKAALAAITESARAELEPEGLTFTAVFPGFVDTPMFAPTPSSTPTASLPAMPPSGSTWRRWHGARPFTSRPASTRSCAWRGCFRRACATAMTRNAMDLSRVRSRER